MRRTSLSWWRPAVVDLAGAEGRAIGCSSSSVMAMTTSSDAAAKPALSLLAIGS
jgi:hypothetical protein